MTRHDLKDQIQHDQFTDTVAEVVSFTQTNRQQVIRWSIIAAVVLVAVGGIWWYLNYQKSIRQNDLSAALSVMDAQIGPPNDYSKTFSSEEAKNDAALKALNEVVAKNGNSNEGMIALYYLGTLKAKKDQATATPDFKRVADSNTPISPLAKIALAQIYLGNNKTAEAQDLLRSIVNSPSELVSKAQAQILLAELEAGVKPQDSKSELKMISPEDQKRAAVSRASDAVSAQLK